MDNETENIKKTTKYRWLITILLDKWITAIITGLCVAVLVPFAQTHFTKANAFEERKLQIWQSITKDLNDLSYYREHLYTMAAAEVKNRSLEKDSEFIHNKENYLELKINVENDLFLNFDYAKFYYDEKINSLINNFSIWYRKIQKRDIFHSPPSAQEFDRRKDIIIKEMMPKIYIKIL